MMKSMAINLILISLFFFSSCQRQTEKEKLSIFCAAGLTNVISELSDSFSIKNNINIKLNLASSGALARQIKQGNKPDIYISANKAWADYVDSIASFSKRKTLYQNKLALIVPKDSPIDSIDFQNTKSIANLFEGYLSLGDPSHVPAGKYAVETLNNLNWNSELSERILPAKDVRSALMVVEMGECEMGIVYYSDAILSQKIKILGFFPENTHEPIIFHALLHKNASESSVSFYESLTNESVKEVWLKNGFSKINIVR